MNPACDRLRDDAIPGGILLAVMLQQAPALTLPMSKCQDARTHRGLKYFLKKVILFFLVGTHEKQLAAP